MGDYCPDCKCLWIDCLCGNEEDVSESPSLTGLCGCGKQGRYFIKDEMACNKHMRCPTYEELSGEVIRIKQALWRITEIVKETPI